MAFFIWKDSFNMGIEEIDRQHRNFLEMLNEYYEAVSLAKTATLDHELVNKLKSYVSMHFDYEVNMLKNTGYIETEQQLKEHNYFESRISELQSSQVQGNAESLNSTFSFLRDWFLNHILESDRKYVPYVTKR
jgi:hemerythrin